MNRKLFEFYTKPAVFAVEKNYQIMVPVKCDMLFWVEVGGEKYFDHSNGIIRSDTRIHSVSIPMEVLDSAGEYTVCFKKIIKRLPYFSQTEDTKSQTYKFYPVKNDGRINIYHLSDTHGEFKYSSKAGTYFGKEIDLLVLNGDILDHSGNIKNFKLTFKLCDAITGGEHPCVFSRGNHDLRGVYAEKLEYYSPTSNGKSYYTFRLGKIWGIVLDCGEDKTDSHKEYGATVSCSQFRREQTQFLKDAAKKGEYLEDGIEYRIVIAHNPFTYIQEAPFDIEQELYGEWAEILGKKIKPDFILAGHLHKTVISRKGSEFDSLGQPCPVVVGSRRTEDINGDLNCFIGCAISLENGKITVSFTDSAHNVINSELL